MQTGAIILAAGASTRMGRPKQLIEVYGETLLRRTIRAASEGGCAPIVVVLGAHADLIDPTIAELSVYVAVNERFERGMGSSVKAGLHLLLQIDPLVEGTVALVCDQPRNDGEIVRRLLALRGENLIVASRYKGARGTPCYFPRALFAELADISDASGAKSLLERDAQLVRAVDWPNGALDLDTPADLARFNRLTDAVVRPSSGRTEVRP